MIFVSNCHVLWVVYFIFQITTSERKVVKDITVLNRVYSR